MTIYGHTKTNDISARKYGSNLFSSPTPHFIPLKHDYEVRNTLRNLFWSVGSRACSQNCNDFSGFSGPTHVNFL